LIQGLAESLRALPPGSAMSLEGGAHAAIPLFATIYLTAIRAAAPVMVTLVVVNFAVAILSRAVPQMNAMMVSFPITIGIGLVMLGASLPIVASSVDTWMRALPAGIEAAWSGFRPALQVH